MRRGLIRLSLPVPPTVNKYYRRSGHKVFLSQQARQYKAVVARECLGLKPMSGEVLLRVRWYRARRQGDIDNILKSLLDALKGYAFGDDARVARLEVERFDTDRRNPRVEVEVVSWQETGGTPTR